MELTALAISICILYFIFLFYHRQFDNNATQYLPDKINPNDYDKIDDDTNTPYKDCFAIYPTTKDKCDSCGGNDYHLLTVMDDKQTHIIDGIVLKPGKYCIRSNLPKCDLNLGILIINGLNDFRCICKYPHFYSGPSCSTKVACGGNPDIPIVTKDNVPITPEDNVDYYVENAHCKCPTYDAYGFAYLNPDTFPSSQCLLDPCLYPIPQADPNYGLTIDKKCKCPTITPNRGSEYSPCSACQNLPRSVPKEYKYPITLAVDCFNEFSILGDMYKFYPCSVLRNPVSCGTAEVNFEIDKEP